MGKLARLNGFVTIDSFDYSSEGPMVTGINVYNTMEMLRGCSAEQLSDFAQSKFGFGIHFPDDATVDAINADTYAFTERYAEQLKRDGVDARTAWSEAVDIIQHMSFSKPSKYWTHVPQ